MAPIGCFCAQNRYNDSGDVRMFQKLGQKFRYFMYGRYGSDKLGQFLLIVGVVLCLLSSFSKLYFLGLLAYVPLIYAIFRMYSRNIAKRQRENQKFLQVIHRFRDRDHSYFACPRCRQKVRVPKGKGQIIIRCPSCGERFSKKT